jgi:hypothetical protein
MNKEFVTYAEALALKELGFDKICFGRFNNEGNLVIAHTEKYIISNGVDRSKFFTLAPLYQQCWRWFREKYGLEGVIQQAKDFTWYRWEISQYNEDGKAYVADWYEYKTYKEAELACLDKLIKIVKNNNK